MRVMQGPVSIDVFANQWIEFEISTEIKERRTAKTQRRARGSGNQAFSGGPLRRMVSWGRRANDVADHQDRRTRNTRLWYSSFPGHVDHYRRRKGDDRRNKLTTEFRYGGRRRYDREERRVAASHQDRRDVVPRRIADCVLPSFRRRKALQDRRQWNREHVMYISDSQSEGV